MQETISTQLTDHHKQQIQREQEFNNEENHQNNDSNDQIYQNDNEMPPNYQQNHHWSQSLFHFDNITIGDWSIGGGSDYGQLPYFIDSGDIIIEMDGMKVAGLTRADVCEIVNSKGAHSVKSVQASSAYGLPIELREYLARRFARGSIDHDLQATIRDNVYMRTIPCTTRPPRPNEMDGVDYKFVSKEQFIEMDRSGLLLESGVYAAHFYGTPLPLSTFPTSDSPNNISNNLPNYEQISMNNSNTSLASKRRRNRSNIAAIDASSLPHGWERISDAHYGVYYIDHINKRTQYERPYETELIKGVSGFGFTLVEIDKGLVVVKSIIPGGPAYSSGVIQPGDVLVSVSGVSVAGLQHSDIARLFATFTVGDRIKLTFARGFQLPPDLSDEEIDIISVTLTKGTQGFGFTISDAHSGQKVKKILDIDRCGALKQGDILMSINGCDLSDMSHLEVVDALKLCPIDESAVLMVKRKKRFRSKTPIVLQNNWQSDNYLPPVRNCKTPNAEMMGKMRDSNNDFMADHYMSQYIPNSNSYTNDTFISHNNNIKSQSAPLLPALTSPLLSSNAPLETPPLQPSVTNSEATASTAPEDDYEYFRASLTRAESGFGFRIVGGAEEGRNVAIGSIVIGGVAHRDGVLKAGDEIISINDRNVMGASHQEVVQLMSQTGPVVAILVRRKRNSDTYDVTLFREDSEGFGFVIISCGDCALIGRIIEGSPAHRCQRLHIRDRIIAVNGIDITALSHPEIVNMIKESGETLHLRIIPADCYTVELIRGPKGFGFSIRGGAEFNGMPLFILRIAPDGPAYSLLNIGDEIIEINSYSTVGLTHSDAVNAISQSGPAVKLKLRRNYVTTGNWAPNMPPMQTLQTFVN